MNSNIIYKCYNCNKNYKSYKTLWNHNNQFHKDEQIIKNNEYKCKNCDIIFDTKHKKYHHQKNCNNKPETEIYNPEQEQHEKQQEQHQPENNINNINNVTTMNGNINNSIVNKPSIVINNYKNDNLDYISDAFKLRLFKNLESGKIKDMEIPIPKLIENVKFNVNHKENNNVKLTSDRSKIGFFYDENKWKAVNKDDLINDLTYYSFKLFKQYFEEKKAELSEDIQANYNIFVGSVKLQDFMKKKIRDKIENIAYIFTKNNNLEELDI